MAIPDAELERFLDGKPIDIRPTLAKLPKSADLALAVRAVLKLVDHGHWFASSCSTLPAFLIRAVLAAEHPGLSHLFLRLAVPTDLKAAALRQRWERAADVLHTLGDTTRPWESEDRQRQIAALAAEPEIVTAIQGLVAHRDAVPLEMLGILAADGSNESIDALIPHLDPKLGDRDARLERLAQIRPIAKSTPALDALYSEIDSELGEIRKSSPALALAKTIGVAAPDVFWFQFLLASVERRGFNALVHGSVRIDSRAAKWFTVWIAKIFENGDRETRFDEDSVTIDQFAGRCHADELPQWLAQTAKSNGFKWDEFRVQSSVPKSEISRIERWLGNK